MMRSAFRNAFMLLCLLSATVNLAAAVDCAPVDDDGTPLTGSSASGGATGFVTCTYDGAGPCTYFPSDGSFSSGASTCPQGLPQTGDSPTTSEDVPPPAETTSIPDVPPTTTTPVATPTSTFVPPPVTTTSTTPIVVTQTLPTTSSTPTTFITVNVPSTTSSTTSPPSASPTNAALPVRGAATGMMGLAGIILAVNLF